MLKKYKILLAIIALTATGITVVLGIWLYGNYRSEREFLVGTAERSLFNVLQNYYQNEFVAPIRKVETDSAVQYKRHKGLLALMGNIYPDLDLGPLQRKLDTIDYQRWRNRQQGREKEKERKKDTPSQLLPLYLLEKIDFNERLLDTLEPRLSRSLRRYGIQASFQLLTEEIHREQFERYISERRKRGDLITRPILVNPENDQFLLAAFDSSWSYVLKKLAPQIFLSFILLTALIGTFLYLLKTIRRQNQLAVLMKSFVNNMTHELKTPVATVMAAIEAIQRFAAKDDKAKMDKYLELSRAELEHLNAMIERVLHLDVDESHRIRLEKEAFNLVDLLRNCLETAEIGTPKKVLVTFDKLSDNVIVAGDEAHLKNVISNLLDNAIKYSDEPVHIRVTLKESIDWVQFSIGDQGKGIAAEHIQHIFDMFYRVSEGNLHDVKGFGLGLAYVKQVVEQHGGNIRVKSEIGKGSTFMIKIPKQYD